MVESSLEGGGRRGALVTGATRKAGVGAVVARALADPDAAERIVAWAEVEIGPLGALIGRRGRELF